MTALEVYNPLLDKWIRKRINYSYEEVVKGLKRAD